MQRVNSNAHTPTIILGSYRTTKVTAGQGTFLRMTACQYQKTFHKHTVCQITLYREIPHKLILNKRTFETEILDKRTLKTRMVGGI